MTNLLNEKGNTTILGLALLLITSVGFLSTIQSKINSIQKQKQRQELFLCTKKLNGQTDKYLKMMKRTNKLIKTGTIVKAGATVLLPGYGKLGTKALKPIIKGLKAFQQYKSISFMKNLILPSGKRCNVRLLGLKTPYRQKGVFGKLSRNTFGEAKLRSKKWNLTTSKGSEVVKNSFKVLPRKNKLRTHLKINWRGVLP